MAVVVVDLSIQFCGNKLEHTETIAVIGDTDRVVNRKSRNMLYLAPVIPNVNYS
jgi:hypothetical protein